VRADKNKGHSASEALEILGKLEKDLERLQVSLAAYGRSDHGERYEALRWHLPVLRQRIIELSASRVADPAR